MIQHPGLVLIMWKYVRNLDSGFELYRENIFITCGKYLSKIRKNDVWKDGIWEKIDKNYKILWIDEDLLESCYCNLFDEM